MYDFTGSECPICHKLFLDGDDLVVCPDCGTPYHRACYRQTGHCLYATSHGPDFEWKPPQLPEREVACASCGAMNEVDHRYCKSCGSPMTTAAGDAARYGGPSAQRTAPSAGPQGPTGSQQFDYDRMYREQYSAAAGHVAPDEAFEGIPAAEWVHYIGPSSRKYLTVFQRMELTNRKEAVSFSAMLWGHYYFFYRKAWKPGILCFVVSLLLNTPAYLWLLKLTESSLTVGLPDAMLNGLMSLASLLMILYRLFCGLYGFYLYKKDSAKRIRRIRQQFTDPEKRAFVLRAQGGTSKVAVVVAFVAMYLIGELVLMLMGPNLEALYALLQV